MGKEKYIDWVIHLRLYHFFIVKWATETLQADQFKLRLQQQKHKCSTHQPFQKVLKFLELHALFSMVHNSVHIGLYSHGNKFFEYLISQFKWNFKFILYRRTVPSLL